MDYERALKEMSAFFQNSSAEMRSLLAEALAALEKSEGNAEQIAALRLNLYRMLRLAWNLGDFSLVGDELPLQLVHTAPRGFAEEFYDETAALVESTGRRLLFTADEPLPSSVALHPYATRRILYQLLARLAAGASASPAARRASSSFSP